MSAELVIVLTVRQMKKILMKTTWLRLIFQHIYPEDLNFVTVTNLQVIVTQKTFR